MMDAIYKIKYCARCVMPETKPDIFFDQEGVCSACRYFEHRDDRRLGSARPRAPGGARPLPQQGRPELRLHHPVSGGKDCTTRRSACSSSGMNPLCVTATTDELSDIGRRNIENLKPLGVDFIEYTTNPIVRRKHQPARARARSATSRGRST